MILAVSSIPNLSIPGHIKNSDKLAHFLEYGILGVLLRRNLMPRGIRGWIGALLVASAVGAMDELYQKGVPGRCSDPYDWMTDTIGAAVGAGFQPLLGRWWAARRSRRGRKEEA